ncbi:hypothetical protein SPOG_01852 [Schizosaccharomyces cryophilus OY26]|uniref:Uncharacterized protein n=1 Tax=Schizosaccharomyces cryophilus (strain OY26 / ATCC MYA-4695 / CBS 11777 / NBRC 106824 / NRRL Y48691) TaxID=653667 RepID=S9W3K2_SCHCR|nr:uncharacterized protein SPOG_01852 [Schizosaccharomyces cryophilus OY26]EPY52530.1 hypothetical protein SPOG_01852 [Schizosaccharomyces cryophilus OY26]
MPLLYENENEVVSSKNKVLQIFQVDVYTNGKIIEMFFDSFVINERLSNDLSKTKRLN